MGLEYLIHHRPQRKEPDALQIELPLPFPDPRPAPPSKEEDRPRVIIFDISGEDLVPDSYLPPANVYSL